MPQIKRRPLPFTYLSIRYVRILSFDGSKTLSCVSDIKHSGLLGRFLLGAGERDDCVNLPFIGKVMKCKSLSCCCVYLCEWLER